MSLETFLNENTQKMGELIAALQANINFFQAQAKTPESTIKEDVETPKQTPLELVPVAPTKPKEEVAPAAEETLREKARRLICNLIESQHQSKARSILAQFNVKKLPEVSDDDLPEIIAKLSETIALVEAASPIGE